LSPATGSIPVKRDPNAPEATPLEKLLLNAGPLRGDGSDKFFGFENVSAAASLPVGSPPADRAML
jgi:ubiquitin carboxyl-terminal hydrolase 9/13